MKCGSYTATIITTPNPTVVVVSNHSSANASCLIGSTDFVIVWPFVGMVSLCSIDTVVVSGSDRGKVMFVNALPSAVSVVRGSARSSTRCMWSGHETCVPGKLECVVCHVGTLFVCTIAAVTSTLGGSVGSTVTNNATGEVGWSASNSAEGVGPTGTVAVSTGCNYLSGTSSVVSSPGPSH